MHLASQPGLRAELAREFRSDRFDVSDEGVFFPRVGVIAKGEYFGRVNGGAWEKEGNNRITTEGYAFMLSVALATTPKPSGLYLALFSGSTAPADNWTAASFAAVANEIVSQSEGYTSATRPVWTPPASVSIGTIDNVASAAKLTMATASQLNVTGAALLTSSQRGGTTGTLISASLYPVPRVFQNGDTYDLGYRLSLSN